MKKEGEMTQTLYAHMNKRNLKKKKLHIKKRNFKLKFYIQRKYPSAIK
jgi:hypothetical protein